MSLDRYLPVNDAQLRPTPAAIVALLVRNIIVSHDPLYVLSG